MTGTTIPMGNTFKYLRKHSLKNSELENSDSTQSITYASVTSHDEISVKLEAGVLVNPSVKFSWNHLQNTYLPQTYRPTEFVIEPAMVETMKNMFQVIHHDLTTLHMKFYKVLLETDKTFPTYFEECAANNQRNQAKLTPTAERMRLHVLGVIHLHRLVITALENFDEAEAFYILKLIAVSHMLMKVQPSHFTILDTAMAKFLLDSDLLNDDTAEAVVVYFNFVTTTINNYMQLQSEDTTNSKRSLARENYRHMKKWRTLMQDFYQEASQISSTNADSKNSESQSTIATEVLKQNACFIKYFVRNRKNKQSTN